ncbi:MAG: VWA domain-containing protein [Planctomycetes bacterium]|nr:VWA domain-containing protein [Planctomycetota bacterium]
MRVASLAIAALMAVASCSDEPGSVTAGGGNSATPNPPPVLESGIALGFVYDTSGSMSESVSDGKGGQSAKWQVANRAFVGIVERLKKFVASPPADGPTRLETALVRFGRKGTSDEGKAAFAIRMAPFDAAGLRAWVDGFSQPDGPTPLGDAVRLAGEAVIGSKLVTKHIVVLTDGKNTHPPDPATALRALRAEADRRQVAFSAHFVAFDVDAEEFKSVRAEGATLLGASDETQLNERMQYILEEKILLEVEHPRPSGAGK